MGDLLLKVTDIRELAPNIKMFELVAAGSTELPRFEAGAHIEVILENGMRKSYSLANDPAEEGRYVTAVLREENGAGGSKWMHDNVAVGDELATTPPTNHFPLAEDAAKHILIAGGIGVTPMVAMGHRLKAIGADFVFHYCTKSAEETAFLEEVKELFGENVVFHHDGGDISKGIKLDDELVRDPARELRNVLVAGAAYGDQVLRILRVVFEFLPQSVDESIDRSGRRVGVQSPDLVE